MHHKKRKLVTIAIKIEKDEKLTPDEIVYLQSFQKLDKDSKPLQLLKKIAIPASLGFGFFFSAFPEYFDNLVQIMPKWTNFSPPLLTGIDYLWDLIGDPVSKANIIYHVPNIVLYSFGIVGVKKLIDAIDHRTWLDKVIAAQTVLKDKIHAGSLVLSLHDGHSLLFVGKGDFIGTQFVLNHTINETITISEQKPSYTQFWNYYNVNTLYEDLKNVIIHSSGENIGEYIFFPVKDDQIFLPGNTSYDLTPHKLDIFCQNIRIIEKEMGWKNKRILIIGDKLHKSFVQSEDQVKIIEKSEDIISLDSIAKKYENIGLLDPSDIVLKKIINIAQGRKIVFRATVEGIQEYKERFYTRLALLGYISPQEDKGILTIGYDIFEDQTEQQTLSRKIDDYFPIVLSKNVHDALLRNGYKKEEFLYVPDLVLETLTHAASQQ
ncbi:MAG: hypothetical protein M3Q44_05175 [bacterium]|nr:hypothetical protein [bacterium]